MVQDVEEGEALERALVENFQRADLGLLEEAAAFQRLVDEFGSDPGRDRRPDRQVTAAIVANTMRLFSLRPWCVSWSSGGAG
ncbi:MAG: hypothetical protein IPQ07_44910 [Myxococcales bacterium]|nr:hypothetical protein [Myxococcales bacterium]